MPLQKEARKLGNSVFVDMEFRPYRDQWAFLSDVRKLSENEVGYFLSKLCNGNELGELKQDDEITQRPWKLSKEDLSINDFPKSIKIVKANMLFIPKADVSSKALNHLKRLAAFKNPEFYRAQAMRLPTFNKPRRQGEVRECVKDYGMVIVDECHHVSAFSFEQILKNVNAKYVYGLSATPTRKDGHHPIVFMQCGPIRYKDDAKKQAEKRPFEHYIIPRFTSMRVPLDKNENEVTIQELYTEIVNNEIRNNLIVDDVVKCYENGRNCIILTERTSHVQLLAKKLAERIHDVIPLTGGMGTKKTREVFAKIADTPLTKQLVLVATGKFIGEGFDEPRLDTLFLAMPISWKGTLHQYAGRLHRLFENKNEVQIYDYVDIHVRMMLM